MSLSLRTGKLWKLRLTDTERGHAWVTYRTRKEMGLEHRLTCPHLHPESVIPGSDDDGPDRSQGGRNPSWIGLPQALHRKMSVFCARQKRKGKKVQWQRMNSPLLGEGKRSAMHVRLQLPLFIHRQRILRKSWESKVSKIKIPWEWRLKW